MLLPNNQQKTKLFQYADVVRFAYNWALEKQMTQFQNGGFSSTEFDYQVIYGSCNDKRISKIKIVLESNKEVQVIPDETGLFIIQIPLDEVNNIYGLDKNGNLLYQKY